jgi:hypothetical protein
VRVNDVIAGDQKTDGSHLISVLEDSVYVVWQDERVADTINVYFSKSIDGGATFAPGILVSNIPDTVSQLWPTIVVDNSGVVYVAWTVASCDMLNTYGIWLAKSSDGGNIFEPAVQISTFGVMPSLSVYGSNVYALFADPSNYPMVEYYFARSTNEGTSFEPAYQVNDVNCAAPIEEFEGVTSLCVDGAGNIYAAWNDCRRTGGNSDIYFAKSSNAGISFGANVPVNDITVQAGDSIQYMPVITVGAENKVYVSFADLRLGSDDWGNNRVYLSVSENGGSSFSPEVLLADHNYTCKYFDLMALPNDKLCAVMIAHFLPEGSGIWLFESNDGGANFSLPIALSDTFDVEAGGPSLFLAQDSNAYAVWQDERLGENDVYFSKSIATTSIEENDNIHPTSFILLENYPNPFNPITNIIYGIPKRSNVDIKIYDLLGREIVTLISKEQNEGYFNIVWDAKDNHGNKVPSGMYLYRIVAMSDDKVFVKTKKLLLLR